MKTQVVSKIPEIIFEKHDIEKNQQTTTRIKNNPACKELNRYASIHQLFGERRFECGRLNTFNFVCGTMSHAKASLHWSVIHYQMTFE